MPRKTRQYFDDRVTTLTAEELRRDWEIVVQTLHLRTGKADRGEALIRPDPPGEIRSWFDEFRPWDEARAKPENFDLFGVYEPYLARRWGQSNRWLLGR